MEWIALAIVFCFLLWKFTKFTLWVTGFVALGLGACVLYYAYEQYDLKKQISLVTISIEQNEQRCPDPELPLATKITNNSNRTVANTEFYIGAYADGFSTNFANGYMFRTGKLISPNNSYWVCLNIPELQIQNSGKTKIQYVAQNISIAFTEN